MQEEFIACELESLKDLLGESYVDFKMLYQTHMNEINVAISNIKSQNSPASDRAGSSTSHRQPTEADDASHKTEVADKSSSNMFYVQDKLTMKPHWTSNRYTQFQALLKKLSSNPDFGSDEQLNKAVQ